MAPEIKKYTSIDAVVNINGGVALAVSARIVNECKNYDREVYFVNTGGFMSGRSALEMISLGAAKGDTIRILVEGDDETAEEIALRLCSALVSKDKTLLRFDRFEKNLEYGVRQAKNGAVGAVLGLIVRDKDALNELYRVMAEGEGFAEIINDDGFRWSPPDGQIALKKHFWPKGQTIKLRFEGTPEQLEHYGNFLELSPGFELVYPTKDMLDESRWP